MGDLFFLLAVSLGMGALGYTLGLHRQYQQDRKAVQHAEDANMIHDGCAGIARQYMEWERK